jgi:hypothetical protein
MKTYYKLYIPFNWYESFYFSGRSLIREFESLEMAKFWAAKCDELYFLKGETDACYNFRQIVLDFLGVKGDGYITGKSKIYKVIEEEIC